MNLVLVILNKQRNESEWTRWGREAKSLSFVENRPEACIEMVTKEKSIFRRDVTGNHRWGSFGQKNPSGPGTGKLSIWWNTIDRINEIPVDSPYQHSTLFSQAIGLFRWSMIEWYCSLFVVDEEWAFPAMIQRMD
jgi:hypothetical protein